VVSREVQSTVGLLLGTVVYATTLGGIFALVFAAAQGRIGPARPRVTAAVLALTGFTVVFLVPFTKYPSNPPAVGSDETIAERTQLYFAMLAISLAAAVAALRLGRGFVKRLGARNDTLAAIGTFVALVAIAELALPTLDEIPAGFPADVIWRFRIATVGTHAVIWATIGLTFGALAERPHLHPE
jgi:predicted cobalt transporter CbtA